MTIVHFCSLFFLTVTKCLFNATMDGKIIMDRTYHQHTDYSIQEIKHRNTGLTISKSLLHPKITQQVRGY